MLFRFIITIIAGILNLLLGIIILRKNRGKSKALNYFFLFCLFAALWAISVAITFISTNELIFLILTKLSYLFAAFIFIVFPFFAVEYPYKTKSLSIITKFFIILSSLCIFYIILSHQLIVGIQKFSFGLHEITNQSLLLIYGIYSIFIMLIGYCILIKKYIISDGINKKRLLLVILGTLISFILGMIFDWYVIYINLCQFDRNGPIFSIFMNLSIFYLLFKKD